jgi:excisionase family DNA binding protein
MDEPLMTVTEAARWLGIGRDSVYQELRSGRLTCVRLGPKGGKVRLTESDLTAYIERCRTSAPTDNRRALRYIKA